MPLPTAVGPQDDALLQHVVASVGFECAGCRWVTPVELLDTLVHGGFGDAQLQCAAASSRCDGTGLAWVG